jgi:hypothetical protein
MMQATRRTVMSDANGTPANEESLEVVEIETAGVDEDGDLVIDDLVVAVDGEGNIVATDETVVVISAEGDAVVDERLSVLGKDGELHPVEEDIAILESDDE